MTGALRHSSSPTGVVRNPRGRRRRAGTACYNRGAPGPRRPTVRREARSLLRFLDQIAEPDEPRVGGKAAHLGRAARAGLPVPPGFVVTTRAFARFLEAARHDPRRLAETPLPPGLTAEIAEALRRLPGQGSVPLAVRSSAVGEDAAGHSYAGQYDTFLGVRGEDALHRALKDTWASWFSERAAVYRATAGEHGGPTAGMAVLVQVLVDPRAAGVLFTVDPRGGSARDMAVEAVLGLGSRLVSGTQEADLFRVRRPAPPRTRGVLKVVERRVADKPDRLESAPSGGVTEVPVPEALRRRPALADAEVLALCRLGMRAERLFGSPQDLEWAIDRDGSPRVLQVRPITARPPPAARVRPSGLRPVRPGVLYTQRFSGERWTEPVTPLSWSLIEPVLEWFIRWEDAERRFLDGTPPARLYRGMPYFNITLFRSLVFRLPGMDPPHFLLEFFPDDERDDLLSRPAYPPDLRVVASIFDQVFRERRHERYAFSLVRNHEEWDRFQPELERRTRALRVEFGTADEGRAQVAAAVGLVVEYVRIHLLSLLFANLFYQAIGSMLGRWVGEDARGTAAALTTEPSGNRTVMCNKALWKLAAAAAERPELARALMRDVPPRAHEIAALPGGPRFAGALASFLEVYGHRSSASWEVFSPRWADDPDRVLGLVGSYLRGGIRTDPFLQEDRQLEERERLYRETRRRLQGHPWRRMAFNRTVHLARRYMLLRENQRFCFDELLHRLQQVYGRLGVVLARDGVLEDPALVPFLTRGEIDELPAASPARRAALHDLARERSAARERDRTAWHPDFLYGDAEPPEPLPAPSQRLSGLGISPGKARGPVRVLRSLDEVGKLRRGDILVTRATDPGWTPLFLTASGLVMELGSLLSHGAVVAREYQLPAVVNISHATRILKDGQDVTIDGGRGVVEVHSPA